MRKVIKPLLSSMHDTFSQIFYFNLRRDHQKNSYERRDYERNEPILGYVPKNYEKKFWQ